MIRQSGFHRWRHAQGLMDADEVVVHVKQRDGRKEGTHPMSKRDDNCPGCQALTAGGCGDHDGVMPDQDRGEGGTARLIETAQQWLAADDDHRAESPAFLIQELLARVQELEREVERLVEEIHEA
jgi:hypothetical protein